MPHRSLLVQVMRIADPSKDRNDDFPRLNELRHALGKPLGKRSGRECAESVDRKCVADRTELQQAHFVKLGTCSSGSLWSCGRLHTLSLSGLGWAGLLGSSRFVFRLGNTYSIQDLGDVC